MKRPALAQETRDFCAAHIDRLESHVTLGRSDCDTSPKSPRARALVADAERSRREGGRIIVSYQIYANGRA